VIRAGRTIRTPTFEIKSGKVHCLVKGTGQVFAAVEGHVMIAGPLHGGLVRPFKGDSTFQWITLDLAAYKGRRGHLEFTPTDGGEFAIAQVIEADSPPHGTGVPNWLLSKLLPGRVGRTPELLAAAYQEHFLDAADRLGKDRIIDARLAPLHAYLANWLIQHPELFSAPSIADKARP